MTDEAFHEIQLNGKQLVFLFMAATVVAVVIFLCGVMVGRGVQVPRLAAAAAPLDVVVDPTLPAPAAAASTTTDAPLTAQETLTYAERLEGTEAPRETLRSPAEIASEPPAVAEPRPQVPVAAVVAAPVTTPAPTTSAPTTPATVTPAPATPAPATPAAATMSEPAGTGWVVQVAATTSRPEAEIIARRLSTKGYPTFITTPAAGVFRVRVGKYADRREAESVSSRLEREEQFKPWLTR